MCGIFFYKTKYSLESESLFKTALAKMNFRGPDHQALHFGDDYVVGHTRLAIIDLNSSANQPFWDSSGRYVISFNGEIYNYNDLRPDLLKAGINLRTSSDTEVLLEYIIKFGIDVALKSIRGMFAFVIFDTKTGEIQAARDHFGQKPLYYFESDGTIGVSSSIHSLLELRSTHKPNLNSYKLYLCSSGIILPDKTFFEGVYALPAGHKLISKNGCDLKIEEYFRTWDLFEFKLTQELSKLTVNDTLDQLEYFFKQSIDRHLVSDIPVGILLSGGIDSSLVYWYAYEQRQNLTAFTKISPGIENIPMQVVPTIISKRPSNWIVNLEQQKNYLKGLVSFISSSYSPSRWGGGPPMNRLCVMARKNNINVLLGGDCADEYLSGYLSYESTFKNFNDYGDFYELTSQLRLDSSLPFYNGESCVNYLERQKDVRKKILKTLELISDPFERFAQANLFHDSSTFLQTCNLPHSDAYSMMASVELRNPMLDLDLVKFISNLPMKMKRNKFILRELAFQKIGKMLDLPKEGTRNFSMKISDQNYWKFDKFKLNEFLSIPKELSKKTIFRLVNLELFHRSIVLGESDPAHAILSTAGLSAVL